MADRYFLDTNILLYLIDEDPKRSPRAQALVKNGAVVSVQVLNEFVNVAFKKYKLPPGEISDALDPIKFTCEIVPLTTETHELALKVFNSTNFGIYDACIIAAAELAGCDVLYTEDMNHGQRVGGVNIRNPFA